ncbi:hypothetical protein ARMGADRAFT_1017172 [Armillaria gallica]|uniref:Uncharacterized protein n=1 Tax=Armillaria gallica TaxID=47427 RepID=A0A2H3D5X6_ARMGA|nr:hypothetical protein ARMGADRAFT_1017172 [Armillaria gallica]
MIGVLSNFGSGFAFGRMSASRRPPIDVWLATRIFYFLFWRFLSRVCIACRRQGYDWVGERFKGENVSAHEWPRYRSLLGYNLRTIFSFTPALRVKRRSQSATLDVRVLMRFTQECPTSYPLPTVKPSMKSEGCNEGDVFGQKWYGIGRVLSSSVSLRRRQTARITFMSNNPAP